MPNLPPTADPTIHRRRLRNELRRAREQAGFAQRDVAAAMEWSLSKLLRIETGAVSITTNDLRALLTHYHILDADRVESLLALARAARERSPWNAYRDLVTPEFIVHLAYESAASIIRSFEPRIIPGLMQTEEYAKELLTEFRGPDATLVDRLVDLRIERQEIFDRSNPPEFHFIIDEVAIHRIVGGPGVMRRQLRRLQDFLSRPNVTIRIVPFSTGIYPRMRQPYHLFEFDDPESEDVLSIEGPQGDLLVREASPSDEPGVSPLEYLEGFFKLEQIARSEETPRMIDAALDRLTNTPGEHPQLVGEQPA
jgi:transcriptional regulator with XRE-family HTH domain